MQKFLFIFTLLVLSASGANVFAADCKVLDTDIASEYSGDCSNGLANGKGKASGRDGYVGEFKGGDMHGKGVYTWPSGNRYEGDFANGKLSGKGVFTWSRGSRYEGDFVDGKRSGFGIFYNINGSHLNATASEIGDQDGVVIGSWRNNKVYERFQDCTSQIECKKQAVSNFIWLRCPLGSTQTASDGCQGEPESMTWHEAVIKAKNFEIDGVKGWRLPSREEFLTMWDFSKPVDLDRASMTVLPQAKNGSALSFWTEFESQFLNAGYSGYGHWMRDLSEPKQGGQRGAFYMNFTNLTRKKQGLYGAAMVSISRWNDVMRNEAIFERDTNGTVPSKSKKSVVLVRGGDSIADASFAETVSLVERNISMHNMLIETRQKEEIRQRQIAEQNELRQRQADTKEAARFSSLVAGKDPRAMYLAAVTYENSGDRSKAKTIYQSILDRHSRSNEAMQAASRLTRLSDVEAVEASNSRAASANYEAGKSSRKQNFDKCMNNRLACRESCRSSKNSSKCQDACPLCAQ
jgi:hypothetical protein